MAGKGNEVGRTFEELKAIIDQTIVQDALAYVLTRVIHDSGYDIKRF